MIDSGVPCIHYGEIYTHYGVQAREAKSFLTEERAEKLRFADPGDVVLASTGETEEDLGKSVAWLGDEPVVIHDACYRVESDFDARFLSYYFATPQFRDSFKRSVSTGKVSSVSVKGIENALIPMVPRQVQEEIVRILDAFVELDRELEQEIAGREKQRGLMLERFFATLKNFEKAPLSRVGEIITGRTPPAKNRDDWGSELDFITPGDIEDGTRLIRKTNRALSETGAERMQKIVIPPDSVCVVCIASLGKMGMNQNWAITNQQINSVKVGKGFDARYIFNALEYRRPELARLGGAGTTTMPIVNKTTFSQIEIPLPPLEVQEEIATELDTFTEYIDNLKRERELRQKQYEYYRDQLLDFEAKE